MSDRLNTQITIRITEELLELIQLIAQRERRSLNEVARALLEKGVGQYKEDLQLFEPLEDDPFLLQIKKKEQEEAREIGQVPSRQLGRKKSERRQAS